MKQIESFCVDHQRLLRGLYVSRKDYLENDVLTTFDIRMCEPNREPVLDTATLHAIEHLGATFLRNHQEYANKTIYFGPMGCRTGFYVILKGDLQPKDIIFLMQELFAFITSYEGEIPGADAFSCGNYLDLNLNMAKYEANRYFQEVLLNLHETNIKYPN